MRRSVKIGLILAACLLPLTCVVGVITLVSHVVRKGSELESSYQEAMDPVRIEHVNQIADLVERYRQISGRWPLAEHYEGQPVVVLITAREGDAGFYERQYPAARYFSRSELEALLASVLGEPIVLPSDPQKFASGRPNHYVYWCTGDGYQVAAHLSAERGVARRVGPSYYKYEVGSSDIPERRIFDYSELRNHAPSAAERRAHDERRRADLAAIAELVREYRETTGRYPLAGVYDELREDEKAASKVRFPDQPGFETWAKLYRARNEVPIDVIIDADWPSFDDFRLAFGRESPRILCARAALLGELRAVLGETVELPEDPRRFALGAPNYYLYRYLDGTAYVTGFLHQPAAGAMTLGEGNHAFTLTVGDEKPGARKFEVTFYP